MSASSHLGLSEHEQIDAARVDQWLTEWKHMCSIVANALVGLSSLAPGGTKWPSFQLPDEHKTYATIRFGGETVFAGGDDGVLARDALAAELIRRAAMLVREGEDDSRA